MCLFFEQRRFRHFGYDPEGEDLRYVAGLVDKIREYISSGLGPPEVGRLQCAVAISTLTILESAVGASGPTTGASFPFLKA